MIPPTGCCFFDFFTTVSWVVHFWDFWWKGERTCAILLACSWWCCFQCSAIVFCRRQISSRSDFIHNRGFIPPKADLTKKALAYASAFFWSWWPDSNRRPVDYESTALPTEPYQRLTHYIVSFFVAFVKCFFHFSDIIFLAFSIVLWYNKIYAYYFHL